MKRSQARGAFSMIEILVVLGIALFVGSLAMGGFVSFQGSQRRSTCQGNMVQIYRACRLYANDNNTFPLPSDITVGGSPKRSGGLGLLWARRDATPGGTGLLPPEESVSYLKSATPLHCPADAKSPDSPLNAQGQVDPDFLTYQKVDDQGGDDSNANVSAANKNQTYSPVRTQVVNDPDYARQLIHLRPDGGFVNIPVPSNTVVTWCRFHRGIGSRPDNALFFDGSVRRMETQQASGCLPGRTALDGWRRVADCTSAAQNGEGAALAQ